MHILLKKGHKYTNVRAGDGKEHFKIATIERFYNLLKVCYRSIDIVSMITDIIINRENCKVVLN